MKKKIKTIESDLTVMGGNVMHAQGEFQRLAPDLPPVSPDWSPVARFGGAAPIKRDTGHFRVGHSSGCVHEPRALAGGEGLIGCSCFMAQALMEPTSA